MECSEIRNTLLRGETPAGGPVAEHVRACATCAELLAQDGGLGQRLSSAAVPDRGDGEANFAELFPILQGQLESERGVRAFLASRRTWLRVLVVCAIATALTLFEFTLRRRADWLVYPRAQMWLVLGSYAVSVVVCVWFALRSLALPRFRAEPILASFLVALPFFVALLPEPYAQELDAVEPHGFVSGAVRCFGYGGLLGAGMLVGLWAVSRSDLPGPGLLLFAAACAGLTANLLLQLHCRSIDPAHLLIGHAGIGGAWLLVLLGAWRLATR